jgi:hypothetical protein
MTTEARQVLAELVAAIDAYNATISINGTDAENEAKLYALTVRYGTAWAAARAALTEPDTSALEWRDRAEAAEGELGLLRTELARVEAALRAASVPAAENQEKSLDADAIDGLMLAHRMLDPNPTREQVHGFARDVEAHVCGMVEDALLAASVPAAVDQAWVEKAMQLANKMVWGSAHLGDLRTHLSTPNTGGKATSMKTIQQMAREAGMYFAGNDFEDAPEIETDLEQLALFEDMVRADEREQCAARANIYLTAAMLSGIFSCDAVRIGCCADIRSRDD